jgi:carbon-monoxide dehydrogenase large subunit
MMATIFTRKPMTVPVDHLAVRFRRIEAARDHPEIGGFGPKLCIYSEDIAVVAAGARNADRADEDRREHFTNAAQSTSTGRSRRGRCRRQRLGSAAPGMTPACARTPTSVHLCLDDEHPTSCRRCTMWWSPHQQDAGLVDLRRRHPQPRSRWMDDGLHRARAEARPRRGAAAQSHPAEKMPYTSRRAPGAAMQYDSATIQPRSGGAQRHRLGRFPEAAGEALAQGRYIGVALAHGIKGTGRGPFESGIVRVSNTGKVTVFTGAANLGQGLRTVLAQISANELGLRPEDITVVPGDTSGAPLGLGAFASGKMVTAGNLVLLASRAVRRRPSREPSVEAAEHDLELKDGECGWSGRRNFRSNSRSCRASSRARRATVFPTESNLASMPT